MMRHRNTFTSAGVALLMGSVLSLSGCQQSQATPQQTPRNVILFVGDGMGVSTITAARIFEGQQRGKTGEENSLVFEDFDNVALVKTYNTDMQVPDSAGTMTAMVTGTKTRAGVLSVAPGVPRGDCAAALDAPLDTLLKQAERAGMRTGLVSTTRITHATPAANAAFSPERNWEDDSEMPEAAKAAGCVDIATQMIELTDGDGVDVMLGGGRGNFFPVSVADPEYPDKTGRRKDGNNLIEQWLAANEARRYVWNAQQFAALPATATTGEQLIGLFEPSHLQFELDRKRDPAGEPSLADMTALAIQRLQGDEDNGFYLVVEGGRIDHAHHFGNARRALVDTVAFARAVERALELVDPKDTLIIVTADHSHTLTISGYPSRGNPILGKVEVMGRTLKDINGKPYTTLGYANGPGFTEPRQDITNVDTTADGYRQHAGVNLEIETHSGEDVAAYATGPFAERVRGVMEQNELYAVMRAALFD